MMLHHRYPPSSRVREIPPRLRRNHQHPCPPPQYHHHQDHQYQPTCSPLPCHFPPTTATPHQYHHPCSIFPSSQYHHHNYFPQTTTATLPLSYPPSRPTPPQAPPLLPLTYIFQGPFHKPNYPPQALFFRWAKPIGKFCTLNTDGSVNVEHHPSGIGGVIRDSRGAAIVAFAAMCPELPNDIDVVELFAIKRGLQLAVSSGVRYINVDTDSSKALNYIYSSPSSCPSQLVCNCVSDIHSLLAHFKSWNCKHVYRETNKVADYLSKFAGTKELVMDPIQFPFELCRIIDEDARGVLYLRLKSVGLSR